MSLQLNRADGKAWYLGTCVHGFRMAYFYFRRGYSFRIGFVNGKLSVGITKTHWHPDRLAELKEV